MNDGMIYGITLCVIFGLIIGIGFGMVGSSKKLGKWADDE